MTFRLKAGKLVLRESEVTRACLELLAVKGYLAIRLHSGTFRSADTKRWIKGLDRGTPDYVVLHPARPGWFLELKRPGGKPRPEQAFEHERLRQGFGLYVAVVDSAEALAQWLREYEGAR